MRRPGVRGTPGHAGFQIGLQAVLTTPSSLNPGMGDLTDVLNGLPGTARLTITGHGLGGTMAATLALRVHETLGKLAAHLECYAFAGATAGNAAFAQYSDSVLRGRLTRVWNSLDIVPHAWNSSDLAQIDSIYRHIDTPEYIKKIVRDVVALDPGYTLCGNGYRLQGVQNDGHPYRKFTGQAGYQHIDAYRELLRLG
jgi:triacylglycerol lipase